MAFPNVVDADIQLGTQATDSTSWAVNWPTNLQSGNLVLVFLAADGDPTFTWPSGMVLVRRVNRVGELTGAIAAYKADGTETGTFTVTPSASERGPWIVYRVTGWYGDLTTLANAIDSTGASTGTTANPNPAILNPANWAAEDTLWFAMTTYDSGTVTVNAWPTSYVNQQNQRVTTATGAGLGLGEREVNAASEDPAAFTLSAAQGSMAYTIAVRPAATAGTTTPQELSATVTTSATISRQVGKLLTATVTTTASIVKSVGKILSATVTSTASIVKGVGKLVSATMTATASMSRSVGKTLSATVTSSATLVKSVGKTLAATVSSVASMAASFVAGGVVTPVLGHFDEPTPTGAAFDEPTPTAGHFDEPTPT